MKKIMFILVLSFSVGSSCLAQNCPPTIGGSITLKTIISGWKAKSDHREFDLERVAIIDGPMSNNPSEPEAELKPLEKNNIQFWAFGAPIEKEEMWMRCEYAHTSVTLSKRIHSTTALCFQRSALNSAKAVKSKVVAECVDSSHKANDTLKPYQSKLPAR
ncbi:STY0301 family protein [Massilia scottii]|uniref:STY0301 family protein n=1 Tax=Massilia scottii TaxID=3057166 RepID=UPI002796C2FE|nr:STY0301 family protein [Massilia sp. CCM 9029]MDQ1835596.1 STY0301 family protein [Massilia sp. CCM 9029]